MFHWKQKDNPTIDNEIDRILLEMSMTDLDSDEYVKLQDRLEKAQTIRSKNGRGRVSPDQVFQTVGYLLGIAIIVGHERLHVITSKAVGFIPKPTR